MSVCKPTMCEKLEGCPCNGRSEPREYVSQDTPRERGNATLWSLIADLEMCRWLLVLDVIPRRFVAVIIVGERCERIWKLQRWKGNDRIAEAGLPNP